MARRFGGPWTEHKLRIVHKYLSAYMTIMRGNERAQRFVTTYVDAFAGSGLRVSTEPCDPSRIPELADEETVQLYKGSAYRALEIDRPFDRYVFVDTSRSALRELEKVIELDFPDRQVEFYCQDANEFLLKWVKGQGAYDRAVVFLDPYGAQVNWSTVEALGKGPGIDLWMLFPLGQAVIRMLGQEGPRPEWSGTLDCIYGTRDWYNYVYSRQVTDTLFGQEEVIIRNAGVERLAQFTVERLRTVFGEQVLDTPAYLRNSKGTCLYILCFAASNKRGWVPARSIASDLVRDLASG